MQVEIVYFIYFILVMYAYINKINALKLTVQSNKWTIVIVSEKHIY